MPTPRPDSVGTLRLLELAATGDPAAGASLLAAQRPLMRRFIDVYIDPGLRSRVDASDIVQDAQLAMSQRLPDYLSRRPMPFHLWARKTAYERMINARAHHRAAMRDVSREVRMTDKSSQLLAKHFATGEPSPSSVAVQRELAAQANDAIALLPAADREIMLLRHVSDLPYGEVALVLNITEAAARQRYGRALMRWRRAFEAISK